MIFVEGPAAITQWRWKKDNGIIVSGFARELCREADAARFVALGERRFKGFADKAQVFRFEWRG